MEISIWKMFTIFGIVSTWAVKALADNKVTLKEAVDLVVPIAGVLGIPTDIEIEKPVTEPEPQETRDEYGKTQ